MIKFIITDPVTVQISVTAELTFDSVREKQFALNYIMEHIYSADWGLVNSKIQQRNHSALKFKSGILIGMYRIDNVVYVASLNLDTKLLEIDTCFDSYDMNYSEEK